MIALIYKRLLQLGKVATALTVMFGIPYGVVKYLQSVRAAQVEQTLKFFNAYNSTPVITYRETIITSLLKHQSEIAAATKDESDYNQAVLKVVDDDQLGKPLLLIMDFFDGVSACVVKELCDAGTTQILFQRRAEELYVIFYPYIVQNRKTTASWDFGLGLETVAKTGRKPAPKS